MEDEDGWQRLEKNLLARLARAGLADLHGLGPRDVCECVLNVVYRIGLREKFQEISRLVNISHQDICVSRRG